jgi:putative AlgH/UPF0301 family transcriptional regulator
MQQFSAQQLLANLQIVGARVGDSVERSVDVVLGGSGFESGQKQKEIVALVRVT